MADIQRYLNLVTAAHRDKPRFIAWLTAALTPVDDAVICTDSMIAAFDLDNAVGIQLDALGEIAGRSRALAFQPTDAETSPILNDDMYRLIIRAKIAQNQWDGTMPSIYELWANLFAEVTLMLLDNQDMSMNALIIGLSTQLEKDLVTNGYIIPKPQGVGVNYSYPETTVFAYGMENGVFKGYEDGYWLEQF